MAASGPIQPAPHRLRTACLLGLVCFCIYLTNLRPMAVKDSVAARLLPFSIVREHNVDLNEFHWLFQSRYRPYFLKKTAGGHFLSAYSIGVPLLVSPLYVPVVLALQHYRIRDDDFRFRMITLIMERVSAALVAAASVSLVYLALCWMTSSGMAAAITLVYGLGTSIWSIGSQSLLQHGGAALGLAGMSLFLVGPDTRGRAVVAGGFAAFSVLARPSMLFFALLALVFVWRERRRHFWAFVSIPIAGAIGLFFYNLRLGGLLKGGYHRMHFDYPKVKRFAGLLISPSRGLFIYTPATLLALPVLLLRHRRRPRWVMYLPIGVVAYLLFYSTWKGWWGGSAYGPRFLTDAMPAFALCAVPAVERLWRRSAGRVLVAALVAWGVAVQFLGVYCDNNAWNRRMHGNPVGKRVWEWSNPQILAAWQAGWRGTKYAHRIAEVFDPRPMLLRPMVPADLAGTIVVEEPLPLRWSTHSTARLRVRITNRGRVGWPTFTDDGYLLCKLGYRWWQNGVPLPQGGATAIPTNVGPGETVEVRFRPRMPQAPGDYDLELLVVQVLGAAVGASGSAVTHVPVQIR